MPNGLPCLAKSAPEALGSKGQVSTKRTVTTRFPAQGGGRWMFQHLLKKWQIEPDQECSVKEKGIAWKLNPTESQVGYPCVLRARLSADSLRPWSRVFIGWTNGWRYIAYAVRGL